MNHLYSEAGFGFSRIFDLLRMDFTWQTSGGSSFAFTIGIAPFL
jgi:hypothetical protein